jgi:hypothetical protein
MIRRLPAIGVGIGLCLAARVCPATEARVAAATETVKVTLPASIGFAVTNLGINTPGSPNPSAVSFSSASLTATHALRISVKADSDFVPPGGAIVIPASKVSWTTSSAVQGTGYGGTLSTSGYTTLFEGQPNKKSGSLNVTWTLGAPNVSLRAGSHRLTMRWKLESF